MEEIFITVSDIGELSSGEDWACWTDPQSALYDVERLVSGLTIEDDRIIWACPNSTVTLRGENLSRFLTPNSKGDMYYLLPSGTYIRMEVESVLISTEVGYFLWGQDETYNHTIKAVIWVA
jgi:hypothetical protein